jgi:hypothetical protein
LEHALVMCGMYTFVCSVQRNPYKYSITNVL